MNLVSIGLGNFVKVVSWYDSECGCSCRVADRIKLLRDKGGAAYAAPLF